MEHRAVERNIRLADVTVAPLFVPGDRPDRVRKAGEKGARVVVIDLEDAVPPAQKAAARELAATALREARPDVSHLVRVNPVSETALIEADIAGLRDVIGLADAVVLPKVESADEVRRLDAMLSAISPEPVPVIATIENAVGVRFAYDIAAASPTVHTLLFGTVDLSADLGVTATPEGLELLTARSTIVLACAAAGLTKPIDGPHLVISDPDGLTVSSLHARQIGFGGKICIHPDQMPTVVRAFAPTSDQVDWAERVVAAFDAAVADGVGVVRMSDGTFIDVPVAEQARTILRTAEIAGALG